ncbi:MAG: undecaprenyl/decaprenyl-phosphate alpha-N-acetylglucosaminyl 1-phosphate transferase [Actinomycetota bacterium]|nr:undecaprenyl/decaprenyl-phosphate alpha-N-acetylglucosaminyl 1-phosphate transferase [Actinomycetota bacterium]
MARYLVLMVVAAAITYTVTPLVLSFSRRIGAVDVPDDRKVHAVPTPTLGGAAIFAGFVGALALASLMEPFREAVRPISVWPAPELVAILIGAAIIFVMGVVDDVRGLEAPVKLSGQLLAAGFVFLAGVRLEYFRFPLRGVGSLSMSPDVSAIATILWIVVIVNAVNLMDGLDGLAAGVTAIAATTFFVYTYQLSRQGLVGPEPTAALVSAIIVGVTVGFLRFNFNPAKIFMGDSGSMTLGFLLATATVAGVGRSATQNPSDISAAFLFYLPLVIPLIVLAIPILDTALAVIRRARKGRPVFHADKEHLHHRLLEIGHGHKQAVLIMYTWTAVIAGMTLAWTFAPVYIVPFAAAAVGLFLYTALPGLARRLP